MIMRSDSPPPPDRTAEEFRRQVLAKGITFWPTHTCSRCGYVCGFRFRGELVWWDSGCLCLERIHATQQTFGHVALFYNHQSTEQLRLAETFWGFQEAAPPIEGTKDGGKP